MTRKLNANIAEAVFLSGHNGTNDPFEDMDGVVVAINQATQLVSVRWNHPHFKGTQTYEGEKFVRTTDLSGNVVHVLHF